MVHCLSHRHMETAAPTVHRGPAQPLVAQDGKWDKGGALVEPVRNKNNTTHKIYKMLHKSVGVMSFFISEFLFI